MYAEHGLDVVVLYLLHCVKKGDLLKVHVIWKYNMLFYLRWNHRPPNFFNMSLYRGGGYHYLYIKECIDRNSETCALTH